MSFDSVSCIDEHSVDLCSIRMTLGSQDSSGDHARNGSPDMLDGLHRQSEVRQEVRDDFGLFGKIDVIRKPGMNSLHAHLRTAR
jgi:hypothetical protein